MRQTHSPELICHLSWQFFLLFSWPYLFCQPQLAICIEISKLCFQYVHLDIEYLGDSSNKKYISKVTMSGNDVTNDNSRQSLHKNAIQGSKTAPKIK